MKQESLELHPYKESLILIKERNISVQPGGNRGEPSPVEEPSTLSSRAGRTPRTGGQKDVSGQNFFLEEEKKGPGLKHLF
ncbi:hypothetical protein ILYODFUR_023192 [Ilyodon furcidens]|uniref:Uncharacterized protein n=1 Tax=Ilyodon furcidens TaxID=33524 RepID=A0ABV0TNH5_9TELE